MESQEHTGTTTATQEVWAARFAYSGKVWIVHTIMNAFHFLRVFRQWEEWINRYKKSLRHRIPRMHASLVDTVTPNLTTNLELRKDEDHLIATVHPINSVRSILFHFHYILPLSCRRTNVTLVEFTADDSVMHKNTQFHILTRPKSKKNELVVPVQVRAKNRLSRSSPKFTTTGFLFLCVAFSFASARFCTCT